MKTKFNFYCLITILFIACSEEHYHDGSYYVHALIYDVNVKIDGENVEIDNSITGRSKIKCKQYKDRIEYQEGNGVTTVLTVLEDGSLKANELITFTKVK